MSQSALAIGEAYYLAMGEKDLHKLGQYLHPEVEFKAPLGAALGKERVLEVVGNFIKLFDSLKIREKLGNEEKVAIIYDLKFPEPIGNVSSVAYLSLQEGLISKIELFYDARPFVMKREEIFSR